MLFCILGLWNRGEIGGSVTFSRVGCSFFWRPNWSKFEIWMCYLLCSVYSIGKWSINAFWIGYEWVFSWFMLVKLKHIYWGAYVKFRSWIGQINCRKMSLVYVNGEKFMILLQLRQWMLISCVYFSCKIDAKLWKVKTHQFWRFWVLFVWSKT